MKVPLFWVSMAPGNEATEVFTLVLLNKAPINYCNFRGTLPVNVLVFIKVLFVTGGINYFSLLSVLSVLSLRLGTTSSRHSAAVAINWSSQLALILSSTNLFTVLRYRMQYERFFCYHTCVSLL